MKIKRVVVLDLFTYKIFLISMLMVLLPSISFAQQAQTETITHLTPPSIADLPLIMDTATAGLIRVDLVAGGLSHPYGMVFLPNGDMLITEREGRVRILRDGILLPDPAPGAPDVRARRLNGLQDIALHPNFSENQLVYLTYSQPGVAEPEAEQQPSPSLTLARGRFDGTAFHDMGEIFNAGPSGNGGSRILFAPDGSLFMSAGGAFTVPISAFRAQDLNDHIGKLLRLNNDGSAHPDNPFTGALDTKPEIYSLGHRNQQGLAINPRTGDLWAVEHAPQGGDELNIILPGRNYGWPLVSYARDYAGSRITQIPWQAGLEQPTVFWVPSIGPSGLTFYTGDKFPRWQGDVFVGSLRTGTLRGTGHLSASI